MATERVGVGKKQPASEMVSVVVGASSKACELQSGAGSGRG